MDAKAEVTCGATDGCVTTDPLFANAAAGDYGLTVASPCKDTGVVESWMADAYDLAGAPRVFGAAPDMGCFERTYPLGTLLLFK